MPRAHAPTPRIKGDSALTPGFGFAPFGFGSGRCGQAEEDEHGAIEAQDTLVVQTPAMGAMNGDGEAYSP
jgi:hypothetical protein